MISHVNSIFGETRPEHEWSNGTEFSAVILIFPNFRPTSRCTPKIFGMKFRKMSVPFDPPPEISGIFGQVQSAHYFWENISYSFPLLFLCLTTKNEVKSWSEIWTCPHDLFFFLFSLFFSLCFFLVTSCEWWFCEVEFFYKRLICRETLIMFF